MSYDEFWNRDYLLIESYKYRHEREIDYHGQLLFKMYAYMNELVQFKVWCEGDPKKRGKQPELTESFEPISERGKYIKNLEEEKQKEINEYLRTVRD